MPVHKRKAPLLLNFIPTYKSTLPNVPKKKKKSLSSPSATTPQSASSSRPDQGSTSDPADQPSTLAPYLISSSQHQRRRRTIFAAEMGRQKTVAKDLLANIPSSVDAQPAPTQPPKPKQKRIKKAQPKAPQITLEDKPVKASDSANDINVAVAHSTVLLLPGDLDRNAEMSEYENYALMLQHSVQAEAAIKAQNDAEEKANSAEAMKKLLEAEKKDVEEKMAQAQKELQEALATKDAELKAADEKGYNEGVADVTTDYEKQVKQGEEVPKDATAGKTSADVTLADRSIDETLQEIDAELAGEKAAEVSSQQSSELQTQPSVVTKESLL
ncbi:MAP7 domain-containing protein 1-like [Camellia sinensis]|uniref:MAP7 domain-containing protein 1-like n=1 Tax=Camellia sinensis TaxID=4442 RepID=UPI0010355F46|nr:MAP7 domain-containing protein 1-like [Camellia sinensis]